MNSCFLRPETQTGAFLLITLSVLLTELFIAAETEAGVLAQLSLAAVESYSDNVQFSSNSKGDFVTVVAPALSLTYKPLGYTDANFTGNLFVPIEIFARNPDLNNFGNNIRLNTQYLYPYSPRLDFTLHDSFIRQGATRTIGSSRLLENGGGGSGSGVVGIPISGVGAGAFSGNSGGGGACGRVGSIGPVGQTQNGSSNSFSQGSLLTNGEWLENQTGVSGNYLVMPRLSVQAGYCWDYVSFIDQGGEETAHSMNVGTSYQITEQSQIHFGYTISLVHFRDGGEQVINDINIGGDYLQLKEIELTPTLTLAGSAGIALATRNNGAQGGGGSNSNDKFRIEPTLNVRLTKFWKDGTTTLGMRRGVTGSFGAGGLSLTTSYYLTSILTLAKNVSGASEVSYSHYDTGNDNFDTFQATATISYLTTLGFSIGLGYNYSQYSGNQGAQSSFGFGSNSFEGNNFFLSLSTAFDVWPSFRLSGAQSS